MKFTLDDILALVNQAQRVTSPYGHRHKPTAGASSYHQGIDIAAPQGAGYRLPFPGTVTFAGQRGGYGNAQVVDFGQGLTAMMGHLSGFKKRKGDKITPQDIVGLIGSTGVSTGPHGHLEFRLNGTPFNPIGYDFSRWANPQQTAPAMAGPAPQMAMAPPAQAPIRRNVSERQPVQSLIDGAWVMPKQQIALEQLFSRNHRTA